ncbi:uncharacterized protein LOC119735190 [Patiria miniata]|uniref:Uncharacterized protein n=1 Tax=Patiria miniata TaxID=46514 RepID=A0A914AMK5_PATMI|nr:uncharacterized protein LOC119735190 [Patiria miniata]
MAVSEEPLTKVLGEISRDHLECGICHERYQTPKILNCLHSFCENCLLSYQKTLECTSVIPCPVCRRDSQLPSDGVSGLKTNFHLKEIVEDFALKEKLTQKGRQKILCDLCEQQESQVRCMDCSLVLCNQCHRGHSRIAGTAEHQILALADLRLGSVSSKVKVEPRCEKHSGEKKRFFCETCDKLICRDCTIVDHKGHHVIGIGDAASRFRDTTKQLMTQMEEQLSAVRERTEQDKVGNADISAAKEQVIKQAEVEATKISQVERNILRDISRRGDLRVKSLEVCGYTPTAQPSKHDLKLPEKAQLYSPKAETRFKNVDSNLQQFQQECRTIQSQDFFLTRELKAFRDDTQEEASGDQARVEARKKDLILQIDIITNDRETLKNQTAACIRRVCHALKTAADLVESAGDADFLELHSVVDADLKTLAQEARVFIPGYPKVEFKSRDGFELGDVVSPSETTLKFLRQIDAQINYKQQQSYSYRYDGQSTEVRMTINFIAALQNDVIVYGYREDGKIISTAAKPYNIQLKPAGRLVALPNGNVIAVGANGVAHLYSADVLTKFSGFPQVEGVEIFKPMPASTCTWSRTPCTAAHYQGNQIILGFSNPHEIAVRDLSSGSVVGQAPLSISPDFLAVTRTGRILVAASNPAVVQGVVLNQTNAFTIHPTFNGDRKNVTCHGICCDSRDNIYVAVYCHAATHQSTASGRAESKVHLHQYSPYGSFMGCLTHSGVTCVTYGVGIAATGDDTLAVAGPYQIQLFKIEQ